MSFDLHALKNKIIPYPLRAFKLSIDFAPFSFFMPKYYNFKLSEEYKEKGHVQWYVRFAWFQLSYSRWL